MSMAHLVTEHGTFGHGAWHILHNLLGKMTLKLLKLLSTHPPLIEGGGRSK